jgi:hypothetical protein
LEALRLSYLGARAPGDKIGTRAEIGFWTTQKAPMGAGMPGAWVS